MEQPTQGSLGQPVHYTDGELSREIVEYHPPEQPTDAAKYLIDGLRDVIAGKSVRDLDEREEAYQRACLHTPSSQTTDVARREALEMLNKVQGLYVLEKSVAQNKSIDDVDPCDALFSPIRAALLAPEVPTGWKFAPIDPTPEMIFAGKQARQDGWSEVAIYDAMIAAAPHPASQTGTESEGE